MAFIDFHWYSKAIEKQVATYVLLPESGEGPFPVFYLLHGLSDDHTIWLRRTRIEHYVSELPLIVVMPDGFRGFYTRNEAGPDYDRYLAQDLPETIERLFNARKDRGGRCIGGLSMGGYGALRLSLAHPERYVSANSHSGAVLHGTKELAGQYPEYGRIFGANPKGSGHDLMHLAATAGARGALPKLRIDCGDKDFLIEDNRQFHRHLESLKIAHEYEEFPGEHNWTYWDLHVREALRFHAAALGLDPSKVRA